MNVLSLNPTTTTWLRVLADCVDADARLRELGSVAHSVASEISWLGMNVTYLAWNSGLGMKVTYLAWTGVQLEPDVDRGPKPVKVPNSAVRRPRCVRTWKKVSYIYKSTDDLN